MSIDIVPEFSPLSLEVKTEALGLSPAEVEALITVPLEADLLNGVPWMSSIQSESVAGLSSIEMSFVPGTDLMHARQMVDERLTQARALPNVSSPPTLLQPIASASQIMKIGLTSKTVSLIDMSVQARWEVVPRLLGVPGVANVSTWGQRDQQLQILVDPANLHRKGVSLEQVIKTAGEAVWASPLSFLESSTPGTGGFVDTPNQRLGVRHVQPISTPAEFAQVPIAGSTQALGEVATLVKDHQPLIGDALFKSGPGLMLVINKFPGFNTVDVTRNVEAALEELKPAMAGIDVNLELYRPASFIERATFNLAHGLLIAGGLMVLGFVVMLGTWRAALVAATSIGLSLIAAGLLLHLRGANIDVMTVAGLLMASGIIVSDAVVDVENVIRRLRSSRAQAGVYIHSAAVVAEATREIRVPMLYATLIVVIAVLPGLFIQGLSAGFFRPLIYTYTTAAVASTVVALTVTPVLGAILLSNAKLQDRRPMSVRSLSHRLGERLLPWAIRSPLPGYVLVLASVLGCVLIWRNLEHSLLPSFNETDINVTVQGAPGTSLPAMQRITAAMLRDVQAIPGVRDVGAHIGRAALSYDIAGMDSAQLAVSIDPAADYDETLSSINKTVKSYPGVHASVQTYLTSRTHEALTGKNNNVRVRIYGQDTETLLAKAEEIRGILAKTDGVVDPQVETQTKSPTLEIAVDLNKAAQYGLKPGDIRRATSAIVSGITVGALYEEQKIFDVVVWGVPQVRDSVSNLQNLPIDTESGDQVRLADVATVRTAPAMDVIRRQGVSRRMDVNAEVSGRPLADVTRDVERQIGAMSFPFEYHAQVLGETVERQAAHNSMLSYAAAAAVMVFLLVQAALRSWALAIASVAGVPVVLVGGLLAIFIAQEPFSLASIVGMVAVLGIAVRNGLVLAMYLRKQEMRHPERARSAVVLSGLSERAPSVIMTVAAMSLLSLTLLFFEDSAGMELAYPAAVAMAGVLVTSPLVTLFLLPAFYVRFGGAVAAEYEEDELDRTARPPPSSGNIPAQA